MDECGTAERFAGNNGAEPAVAHPAPPEVEVEELVEDAVADEDVVVVAQDAGTTRSHLAAHLLDKLTFRPLVNETRGVGVCEMFREGGAVIAHQRGRALGSVGGAQGKAAHLDQPSDGRRVAVGARIVVFHLVPSDGDAFEADIHMVSVLRVIAACASGRIWMAVEEHHLSQRDGSASAQVRLRLPRIEAGDGKLPPGNGAEQRDDAVCGTDLSEGRFGRETVAAHQEQRAVVCLHHLHKGLGMGHRAVAPADGERQHTWLDKVGTRLTHHEEEFGSVFVMQESDAL